MTIEPVVKTLRVDLDPQAAFDLFTARMGEWWPLESHSVSGRQGKPSQSLEMGKGVGAEIIEIAHDGTRHVWGTIQEWSPGAAFASTWHPGRTDTAETHVRVTFKPDGHGTLLTLTHSNWEALGEEGAKSRDGYDGGWNGVLARYEAAA